MKERVISRFIEYQDNFIKHNDPLSRVGAVCRCHGVSVLLSRGIYNFNSASRSTKNSR